jgi:hypothetical protein
MILSYCCSAFWKVLWSLLVGVIWDGVEIVSGEECMDFVGTVMCVYDHRGFVFVCSDDHWILVSDFLFYPLLSLMCDVVVVGVVYLPRFFGCHDAEGILDLVV